MKRYLLLLFIAASTLMPGGIASAHILRTNGTVGAVLHILPSDEPKSGQLTTYELAFNDTGGQFSLYNCDCRVSIMQNNRVLLAEPLRPRDELTSRNNVTFPRADVYVIRVFGTPHRPSNAQPFEVGFAVRVEEGSQTTPYNKRHLPPLLLLGLALTACLILLEAYSTRYDTNSKLHK